MNTHRPSRIWTSLGTGIALVVSLVAVPSAVARGLSLEERVEAQRAIEAVYWRHRIWPEDNPTPKPPLNQMMPERVIRTKVEDYLAKSVALEKLWNRPVTAEQLQAEMDRMAAGTKDAALLRELFSALGDDPFLIAECLARPILVDRLIHNWYAYDSRFHGAVRAEAETQLSWFGSVEQMELLGGEYHEVELGVRGQDSAVPHGVPDRPYPRTEELDAEAWRRLLAKLADRFGVAATSNVTTHRSGPADLDMGEAADAAVLLDRLPVDRLSGLFEEEDHFAVRAVLEKTSNGLRLATVRWPKRIFDDWWEEARAALQHAQDAGTMSRSAVPTFLTYRLPEIAADGCVDDTWSPTPADVFPQRAASSHAAIWTGTEMIVWGGSGEGVFNTGLRYNPSTDSWIPMTTGANAPTARHGFTAVWTGTEMIVWGGRYDGSLDLSDTGGRYSPASDSWLPTSTAPAGRRNHTAVWTGTEMIVWGGWFTGDPYISAKRTNTGWRYDPANDSWTPTSTGANIPSARDNHTAVWTGTEMVVWGGYGGLNTGGRYDPANDSWTPTSTGANVPSARSGFTAVWTGTEMVVWGGYDGSYSNTGGRYDPANDAWTATSTGPNVPSGRSGHTTVWAGTEMIVWGGKEADDWGWVTYPNAGGRYDPATDTWTPTSTGANVPGGRSGHTAVWTGTEVIVWGGSWENWNAGTNTGGRYDPASDSWVPTWSGAYVPAKREGHTAIWTGTEMIVWGGGPIYPYTGGPSGLNTGGRYDPATHSWLPTSTGPGTPYPRGLHTAVWTGTEMIVWGGGVGPEPPDDWGSYMNKGGRYNPASDTWVPTSTGANVPSERAMHTAVWTGAEMIIWGGDEFDDDQTNTGGRYNPETDSWVPMSTSGPVPDGGGYGASVWTGKEMFVRSGWSAPVGHGRYNPATDTWVPMSTVGAPSGFFCCGTAVWTGTEVIFWGGMYSDESNSNSGSRYNPETDCWIPTSLGPNVPSPRQAHTAVWTGTEMIVWGGAEFFGGSGFNTGGRYDPSSDSWVPTSTGANVPSPRAYHTAVWTGSEMIVWGGSGTRTGGRYCACAPRAWYQDSDGDGYGDPGTMQSACTQPLGYLDNADDCDDGDALVYPGAAQVCDGQNNDCDDPSWPDLGGTNESDDDGDMVTECAGDCDDADPGRFPGNPEVCDGVDRDCNGHVDDIAPPGGIPSLSVARTSLSWSAVIEANSYDAVRGDLSVLRSTGGDFSSATKECLADNEVATTLAYDGDPTAGEGYWFLVRPVNCGGDGTYRSTSEAGGEARDSGIGNNPPMCTGWSGPIVVPGGVIISGFQASGSAEWIELFNTTDKTISLETMNLITRVDLGLPDGVLDVDWDLVATTSSDLTGAAITGHGFYLIGEPAVAPAPDLVTDIDLSTEELGSEERALSLELEINGHHMDYVLYGRHAGADSAALPPGDLAFEDFGPVTLVSPGSTWRYLDDGSDQGMAWRNPDFDDSGWASGDAELGYGDGDEATVVDCGCSPCSTCSPKHVTTYFRHTFNVVDAWSIPSLTLNLLRDDGAVVYLNGKEIRRDNLPTAPGPIQFDTLALEGVFGAAEKTFSSSAVPCPLLEGPNVLAVEIHQQRLDSSDISFDLELIADSVVRGEVIRTVSGTPPIGAFSEGVTQRLSAEDLYAGFAVAGFYTDEVDMPGNFPSGVWTCEHAPTGGNVPRNSSSLPVPRP